MHIEERRESRSTQKTAQQRNGTTHNGSIFIDFDCPLNSNILAYIAECEQVLAHIQTQQQKIHMCLLCSPTRGWAKISRWRRRPKTNLYLHRLINQHRALSHSHATCRSRRIFFCRTCIHLTIYFLLVSSFLSRKADPSQCSAELKRTNDKSKSIHIIFSWLAQKTPKCCNANKCTSTSVYV